MAARAGSLQMALVLALQRRNLTVSTLRTQSRSYMLWIWLSTGATGSKGICSRDTLRRQSGFALAHQFRRRAAACSRAQFPVPQRVDALQHGAVPNQAGERHAQPWLPRSAPAPASCTPQNDREQKLWWKLPKPMRLAQVCAATLAPSCKIFLLRTCICEGSCGRARWSNVLLAAFFICIHSI